MKAVKIVSFDGSCDILPSSQIFGQDYSNMKSESYWISAWILDKKNIQYSTKKQAYFDSDTRKQLPSITITKHIPKKVDYNGNNEITSLKSE